MKPNDKQTNDNIETDPFGTYTGIPQDPQEPPIQDADDL